jgi:NADH-quinone oxidoreductase subunit K
MNQWQVYTAAVLILLGIGIFCLISRRNLIQLIIGIEVMAKAVCLSFILAGALQGNEQIAQAIVVTIILIEAVSTAVALALIVGAYRHTGSLDVNILKRLRG